MPNHCAKYCPAWIQIKDLARFQNVANPKLQKLAELAAALDEDYEVSFELITTGALTGKSLDPMALIREPLIVHETASIFRVLNQFKKAPVSNANSASGAARGIAPSYDDVAVMGALFLSGSVLNKREASSCAREGISLWVFSRVVTHEFI
jgi:hypothetical protein